MSVSRLHIDRIGATSYNNQQCLMKVVEYFSANDIIVEFQDKYRAKVHTKWNHFKNGNVKNPYYKNIYGIAYTGNKIDLLNSKKEYRAWRDMLRRCYDEKYLAEKPTYKQCSVCDEWMNYENFYNWIIKQDNYNVWKTNTCFHLDKDILLKHNKIYSPQTCCLVPDSINALFVKSNSSRGQYPIGVSEHYKNSNTYMARCNNPLINEMIIIGVYPSINEAFVAYKQYKESLIKTMAEKEYQKHNITQVCYHAMIKYQVEITD